MSNLCNVAFRCAVSACPKVVDHFAALRMCCLFMENDLKTDFITGDKKNEFGIDAVVITTQQNVPDFAKGARTHNEKGGDQGSKYDHSGLNIQTAKNAPKPVTTVDQVNQQEVRHQGISKFTCT